MKKLLQKTFLKHLPYPPLWRRGVRGEVLLIFFLFLFSCSNTKYLPPGEELYTGADVKIISEESIPEKNRIHSELDGVLRPQPNQNIFGIFRPSLRIYNLAGEPRRETGGIRRWIREKLGEPPVLLSEVSPTTNMRLIINRLENNGIFDPEVSYEIIRINRKASVQYFATVSRPYQIRQINLPKGDDELRKQIRAAHENSLLEPGGQYNLQKLVEERERIDRHLKNRGFFYFNPDFIIFRVDSTVGTREVEISINVKEDIPRNARRVYVIRDVVVNTGYTLEELVEGEAPSDTLNVHGLKILHGDMIIHPDVIRRAVFLRTGERYNRSHHEITLNHLMGLGTFQYANIRFNDVSQAEEQGVMDAVILLTPQPKKSLRLELRAVSKSNNFAGPGLNANFRNRNAFNGAELFILNFRSAYETQISGVQRGLNSYELGVTGEIQIPKFIAPFNVNPDRPIRFIPRTRIMGGYSLLDRVQFFRLNSFNLSFGYLWSESLSRKHEFNPISLNYVMLGNTSPQFDTILARNPILRRSFEQQFIFGSIYTYTYNDQLKEERMHNFFFMANLDLAGNTLYAFHRLTRDDRPTEDSPFTIAEIPFAQYARTELDFRYYIKTGPKSRIATRLITGAGIAYGNATTMPYVKQFFIGGVNSIRAFQVRSIGPGTYRAPLAEEGQRNFFFDQTGDLRLEGNLEYRFPIFAIVRGAVFLDAGNIWTVRENVDLSSNGEPEGQFKINTFHQEIAVGSGFGLRFDASFFVLRFDLGIPLRKPFIPQPEERWVIDEIDFGDPLWRRQNLVLNIAIGYPF
jgi:outer membrane protein insertion porin family